MQSIFNRRNSEKQPCLESAEDWEEACLARRAQTLNYALREQSHPSSKTLPEVITQLSASDIQGLHSVLL